MSSNNEINIKSTDKDSSKSLTGLPDIETVSPLYSTLYQETTISVTDKNRYYICYNLISQ